MKLNSILAALQFTPFLIVPIYNFYRMVVAVRADRWRRARWFARAAGTFTYLDVLVWLRGVLAGGLYNEETACTVWHQQPYDEAYREAHGPNSFGLFPLSNPCNAYFDLVPGWVNPLLVVFTVLALSSFAGIVWARHVQTPARSSSRERTP